MMLNKRTLLIALAVLLLAASVFLFRGANLSNWPVLYDENKIGVTYELSPVSGYERPGWYVLSSFPKDANVAITKEGLVLPIRKFRYSGSPYLSFSLPSRLRSALYVDVPYGDVIKLHFWVRDHERGAFYNYRTGKYVFFDFPRTYYGFSYGTRSLGYYFYGFGVCSNRTCTSFSNALTYFVNVDDANLTLHRIDGAAILDAFYDDGNIYAVAQLTGRTLAILRLDSNLSSFSVVDKVDGYMTPHVYGFTKTRVGFNSRYFLLIGSTPDNRTLELYIVDKNTLTVRRAYSFPTIPRNYMFTRVALVDTQSDNDAYLVYTYRYSWWGRPVTVFYNIRVNDVNDVTVTKIGELRNIPANTYFVIDDAFKRPGSNYADLYFYAVYNNRIDVYVYDSSNNNFKFLKRYSIVRRTNSAPFVRDDSGEPLLSYISNGKYVVYRIRDMTFDGKTAVYLPSSSPFYAVSYSGDLNYPDVPQTVYRPLAVDYNVASLPSYGPLDLTYTYSLSDGNVELTLTPVFSGPQTGIYCEVNDGNKTAVFQGLTDSLTLTLPYADYIDLNVTCDAFLYSPISKHISLSFAQTTTESEEVSHRRHYAFILTLRPSSAHALSVVPVSPVFFGLAILVLVLYFTYRSSVH